MKNRRDLLVAALHALEAQCYRDFETIVVDDGSTDGSGDLARSWTVAGRPVCVLQGDGRGAVVARKMGIEHAAGEILAFTDSDCVPLPDWLRRGVEAIDEGADMVNGLTRPAREMLPFERSMGSGTEGLFPTCNMFYRRDAYQSAGGFDEGIANRWGFRPDARAKGDGFGEDVVLGWKVARRGTHRYAPDAVVEHHVFPPDFTELVSRAVRVAGFPAMIRDVPELRATLCHNGVQLGERNRLPVYAAAIAVGLGRKRVAAGAAAVWAAMRLRELRRYPIPARRQLAFLPLEMGLDVLTAGSLVAGSIRARSLVL